MTDFPDPPAHNKRELEFLQSLAKRYGIERQVAPTVDDLLLLLARVERLERRAGLNPITTLDDLFE